MTVSNQDRLKKLVDNELLGRTFGEGKFVANK